VECLDDLLFVVGGIWITRSRVSLRVYHARDLRSDLSSPRPVPLLVVEIIAHHDDY
jgi:hypothetical protein